MARGTFSLEDLIFTRAWSWSFGGASQRLRGVPARAVLFLAEGRTKDGAPLLRGCTAARVRGGETIDITVLLKWYCMPRSGGELPGNDRDDDCDGLTDECHADGECNDDNVCTLDLCEQGSVTKIRFPTALVPGSGSMHPKRWLRRWRLPGEPKDCGSTRASAKPTLSIGNGRLLLGPGCGRQHV